MNKTEDTTNETRHTVTFTRNEVIDLLKAKIIETYPGIGNHLQNIRPNINGLDHQDNEIDIWWTVNNSP